MKFFNEISELTRAGVITEDTADKIRTYYENKETSSPNRLFIAFGILGAILVGLGIILVIAHNWDNLPRSIKTVLAFLPLVLAQIICGYILLRKRKQSLWRESGSVFLFFAIGACIGLISQIYNIPGDLSSFLLTWMLLSLPIIYLMKSSFASLLYLLGITFYAVQTGYWTYPETDSYLYWLLLLLDLPYYFLLLRKKPASNFSSFHNWIVALSLVICLGTLAKQQEELMFIAYFSLFGLFYSIGNSFFRDNKLRNNAYRIIGAAGTIVLLMMLSFDWFWQDLRSNDFLFPEILFEPEFISSAVITLLAIAVLYMRRKRSFQKEIAPIASIFPLFILTFILGIYLPIAVVLINLYVLLLGILIIRKGVKKNHLGILNYGLLIISVLIICRFFDTDLSFITRGILFIAVGIGFFTANYWILKRRKIK